MGTCLICRGFTLTTEHVNATLNDQMHTLFLLRKIMEIPLSVCEKLVSKKGHPSHWITLCLECDLIVQKARKGFEKMLQFQKKFDLLKTQLATYIKIANKDAFKRLKHKETVPQTDIPDYILTIFLDDLEKFEKEHENDLVQPQAYNLLPTMKVEREDMIEVEMQTNNEDCENNDGDSVTEDRTDYDYTGERDSEDGDTSQSDNDNITEKMTAEDLDLPPIPPPRDSGEPRFICERCNSAFKYKVSLTIHERRVHTKEKPEMCDKCGQKFIVRIHLLRHYRRAHPECRPPLIRPGRYILKKPKKVYVCEKCGRNCTSKSHFDLHMESHAGHKRYLCELCCERFYSISHLNHHKQWKHFKELNIEPESKCKICGKLLSSIYSLKSHMKSQHTKEFNIYCQYCPRGFVTRFLLDYHIRTVHTGEKPFKCDQCEETFFRKRKLQTHIMQKHTKQFDHQCTQCDWGFPEKKDLRRHMRVHSGVGRRRRVVRK